MDVTQEHKVFSASATVFRASEELTSFTRRAASLGPGLSYYQDLTLDDEEDNYHQRSMSRGRDRLPRRDSDNVVNPRFMSSDRYASGYYSGSHGHTPDPAWMSPPPTEAPSPASSEHRINAINGTPYSYTRPAASQARESPAQTLEDFRNALRNDLDTSRSRHSESFSIIKPA
jgi:hypothetical protein